MRAATRIPKQPSSEHGLLPFRRTVVISTAVELPFAEVERAAHICLADLVESAFAAREAMTRPGGGSVDAPVAPRDPGARRSRGAKRPSSEAMVARPCALASPRGRGLFPVMDVDLLARSRTGTSTELVLEGTYYPPLGVLGLAGDLVLGRHVARSTATTFMSGLGRAMEVAVHEGRCAMGRAATHSTREVA